MSANAHSHSVRPLPVEEEPDDDQQRRNEWRMHGHWTPENRPLYEVGSKKADPVAQLGMYRQFSRVWCAHLTSAERNLLLFLLDQTIGWGKPGRHFTHRQIEEGNGYTGGARIGRTHAKNVLKSLEAKGVISVDRYDDATYRGDRKRGNYITVNPDWEPPTPVTILTHPANHPAMPSDPVTFVTPSGSEIRTDPVTILTHPGHKSDPLPVTKVTPFKEETYQEKAQKNEKEITEEPLPPLANATTVGRGNLCVSSSVQVRMRQRPSRSSPPGKEDTPPVPPAPLKAENDPVRPTVSADELDHRLLAAFRQHCPGTVKNWPDSDRRAAADFLAANWTKVCPEEALAYEFADWLGEWWPHWCEKYEMPDFPSAEWLKAEGRRYADTFLDE